MGSGQNYAVDRGHQAATDLVVRGSDEPQDLGRHASRPAGLGDDLRAPRRLGGRLEHHGITSSQGGQGPAGRDGNREVPRGDHRHHAQRGEHRTLHPLQLRCPLGVPPGKVDGLADLRVSLGPRLGSLVGHGHHEVVVAGHKFVGDSAQHVTPFDSRTGPPGLLGSPGHSHLGIQGFDRGGHRGVHRLERAGGDRSHPGPGGGQGRIGVRMVPKQPVARRWPLGLSTGQVGEVPTAGHRCTEQAGLLVKLGGPGPQAE